MPRAPRALTRPSGRVFLSADLSTQETPMPKPVRYALWSLLVIAPTMIILPSLVMTLADVPATSGSDSGPMTATLSIFALMLTAFVAPVIVLPERKAFPFWTVGGVAVGFLQLFALLFGFASGAEGTMAFSVHIPAVVVCLN